MENVYNHLGTLQALVEYSLKFDKPGTAHYSPVRAEDACQILNDLGWEETQKIYDFPFWVQKRFLKNPRAFINKDKTVGIAYLDKAPCGLTLLIITNAFTDG